LYVFLQTENFWQEVLRNMAMYDIVNSTGTGEFSYYAMSLAEVPCVQRKQSD